MNKVVLIGRLTKDIEVRAVGNTPKKVAEFSLACQTGKEPEFINCVAWNKTAETMEKYVKKGALIAIEGRIQTRNYENKEGNKVYVTEVVCENMRMLDTRNSSNNATYLEDYEPSNNGYEKDEDNTENVTNNNVEFNISEDDLPF